MALQVAARLQQHGRTQRLRTRIHLLQRGRGVRDTELVLCRGLRGLGRLLQHGQVAGADALLGIRHRVPQLENPGEQRELLGRGERVPGIGGGVPGADQRPGVVVCVVPVVGLFDHRPARCDQPGIRPQGLGESRVPAGALAGQQVVIDRLADESVPERVSVASDDQHVGGHRRPQRAGQSVVFQAGHRGQQGVLHLGPGRTRRPQDDLGFLGEPVHRGQQQIAQRLGQLRVRLAVTAQQLLHEQRVALSAPVDLVGH